MNDERLIKALAAALAPHLKDGGGMHTKAPSAFHTGQLLHGDTGIWSTSGLEREIISTHVRPMGLAARLPAFPSVYERPFFGALTGFSGDLGSEATNPCDDAPTGYVKACNLTAQFGRLMRDTETMEIDKIILRKNRGDHTDLVLQASVLGDFTGLRPENLSESDILNLTVASEMVSLGVRAERKLTQHIWQGSPANNTSGGGYKEFPGLDNQIQTGQVDAETGTTCPSLDSLILDFDYNSVEGGGLLDIVEYLQMTDRYLRTLASDTGMDPATWVIVMRKDLWWELTEVWPCAYGTNRCSTSVIGDNSRVMIDGRESVAMRDQMRRNLELEINGSVYDVVLDDGIFEHTNVNNANVPAGSYASSIYFVPLRTTGNFPSTYLEHVDYRQTQAESAFLNNMPRWWSDGGRWLWAYEDTGGFCFKLKAKTEQRVVLRTPQLAAKVQNVRYSPIKHLRDSLDTSSYFVNGGVSLRSADSVNSVWL